MKGSFFKMESWYLTSFKFQMEVVTFAWLKTEIGVDNNTTTVILMPFDFTNAAKSFTELVNKKKLES